MKKINRKNKKKERKIERGRGKAKRGRSCFRGRLRSPSPPRFIAIHYLGQVIWDKQTGGFGFFKSHISLKARGKSG